jgi:hypothetical protein
LLQVAESSSNRCAINVNGPTFRIIYLPWMVIVLLDEKSHDVENITPGIVTA